MDMQGNPIGSTNQGMKNTIDSRAKEPTSEASGPVASDSLAAESYNAGGAYSENADAAPSGVEGSKSTYANTDTSAATTLGPTPDAATREAQSAWGDAADLKGAGSGSGSGSGGSGGYSGSGSDDIGGSSGNSGSGARAGNIDAGSAPSYSDVASTQGGKPKGSNLQEGGLEGEANNDYEIGSDMDPGRVAVQSFQKSNAAAAGGTGPTQREITGETTYDALESDTQA